MAEGAQETGSEVRLRRAREVADAGAVWQSHRDDSAPAGLIEPSKPKTSTAKAKNVAKLPTFIEPQLTKSLERPPTGSGWAHEIKFDGYRMQLRTVGGKATPLSRKGLDWSSKFPEIVTSGAALSDGIVDGEVVALDHTGAPDFAALQAAISDAKTKNLVFFVFDQMFAGKRTLGRSRFQSERPVCSTASTTPLAHPLRRPLRYRRRRGAAIGPRMDLEGIVSKRLDAPYHSGRSENWGKSKCRQGQEVVIGGWTTTGDAFRSLIAGVT